MIVVKLTAAIDAAGTTQTFYLCDEDFVTSATDTPANTAFDKALIDPGSVGVHVFSDGKTGGGTLLEVGEIIIPNTDGAYDAWVNYSFDGRAVETFYHPTGAAAFPAGFTRLLYGTAEGVEGDFEQIIIRLRDYAWVLDKPILTTQYAGTNSLPNGLEGTVDDIKGRLKPKAFGKVLQVPPPLVNTSRLIYEVGVCSSVDAVYDSGLALTKGADYTSQTDMETTAPTAGQFRAWPAGGYFRLNSTPAGEVTADVTEGVNAAARTTAQVLSRIAQAVGVSTISSADVSALDIANSAVVGIWVNDSLTAKDAMDQVCESIGAYYFIDGSGTLRMGQLTAPSGTPVASFADYDLDDGITRRPPSDFGIPVWRIVQNHTKIYSSKTSGLAASVTAAMRAYLAEEYRSASAEDTSIKTQWLRAGQIEWNGLLTASADATTEAARKLALYKVARSIFDVTIGISDFATSSLKLMDVVQLSIDRYGMSGGKLFRLIGITIDLSEDAVTLSLWG